MPVRHSPPRSLAQRIMLSFALLVTFVAGFYAFALYQSIEFTEQQLISGILRDEVARAVDTLERGETPRLPEDTRLYGAPPLEAPPPAMLGTVANNLVKNAVAYTESGVVTITETSEGFIVSDSGPGLAGDEAARIFEHGVRGSAAVADGSGAGLGLSIVSRICRRSGWTVTAGKAPEGGAAFTVTMTKAVDARRADRL